MKTLRRCLAAALAMLLLLCLSAVPILALSARAAAPHQGIDMKFVTLPGNFDKEKRQPAMYARRTFNVKRPLRKATLRMSALGVYEGYLNGKKITDEYLRPGYTDYNYRVQYQERDVTHQLAVGENTLSAVVGDGWYRGAIGISSTRNVYGDKTAWGFQLILQYADGKKETIDADRNVLVCNDGPLRENDLKVIEKYDARRTPHSWQRAEPLHYSGDVVPEQGEKVRGMKPLTPKVLKTPNGQTVLDFGQNHSGHVKFRVTGKAGQTVKLTMGEVLDENGNFTQKNLVAEGAEIISGEVGQSLEYTLKNGTQTYEPKFLISGYRYVLVENWPEEVKAENFESIPITSDLKETGTFTCSNPKINKLVENTTWSRRSNFVDIPTDCPTRERAGWSGDMNVYGETAMYMTDMSKFLKKWFEDYKLEQGADGSLPYVTPDGGYTKYQRSCAGWSDALINLTWELYWFTGDRSVLEDNYDACRRYMDYEVNRAKAYSPRADAHGRYIIETGFHYGEWLEPGRPMYRDFIKDFVNVDTEVTTAWFYYSMNEVAQMARVLGKQGDVEKYGGLASKIRDTYQEHFLLQPALNSDRQCRLVRPVAMNLSTPAQTTALTDELARRVAANDYKIGTGFLTTWKIMEVLSESGHVDTAYRLLENEKEPGWLYEVDRGATTTWENWNGIDAAGKPTDSQNHFAPGAVVSWLFKHCAGIQPLKPGFREVLIQPTPGGSLTYAKATHESPQGMIVSEWSVKDGQFILNVTTPKGVPTTVKLPDGSAHRFADGGAHRLVCALVGTAQPRQA